MKTPEEIKKGLSRCEAYPKDCIWCEFAQQCDNEADALAYIQQLEKMLGESFARNAPALEAAYGLAEKYERAMENAKTLSDAVTKLERERDAAVEMMRGASNCCIFCKHFDMNHYVCKSKAKNDASCWEWRGLPEV